MYKIYILPFFLIVLFSACKKEVESTAPSITFKSISPSSLQIGKDNFTITFSYLDNDGDLGENSADVKNMFVKDNRNGVVYQFRIPQLAPSGSTIAIQGDLNIDMPNVGISDGESTESVTFDVHVKDRAGNESNTITSSAVTVSAP
ncbi:MAG: hypothetical protein NT150_14770 [Bacteroidetes bacterium]|nr:hypothetical protein [Bacteroidota bacterium]